MRIILLRHGECLANIEDVFPGQVDSPLSRLGIEQAECAAKYLKNFKIDKIYSSDLSRAIMTAEATNAYFGLDIIIDERLREINGGDWQMKKYDSLSSLYPEDYRLWKTDTANSTPTNGESVKNLAERMLKVLIEIAENNKNSTVLIATHSGAIRAFESIVSKNGLNGWNEIPFVSNASITIYEYKNGKFDFIKRSIDDYLGGNITNLPESI